MQKLCISLGGKTMLIPATIKDYPVIQNMARFYVYDLSRYCGLDSVDWAIPADGLYEAFDFKSFFTRKDAFAYLVKCNEEIAGFVLIDKDTINSFYDWRIAEFFILARFQTQGIGQQVANQLWSIHPGTWEVAVIPENKKAFYFWEKIIANFTNDTYEKKIIEIDFDDHQPQRVMFYFNTEANSDIFNNTPTKIVNEILEVLKSREPIFHHPEILGKTKKDIENQMAQEFWEVGASGNIYLREEVLETLIERYNDKKYKDIWEAYDFKLTHIADNAYLLTYYLIQNSVRHTRRSTIWINEEGQWKILYHQGTVIE